MGGDDAEKLISAVFRRVVQDDILKGVHMGAFPPGGVHAAEDGLLGLRSPAPEPPLQLVKGGRRDKDQRGLRITGLHLLCALDLDLQYHIVPLGQMLQNGIQRRPVKIAHIFRVLQQALLPDQLGKAFPGDKVIMYAVDLAGAGRPGGGGDGKIQMVRRRHDLFQNGPLACAAGAGDDKQCAALIHPLPPLPPPDRS